MVERQAVVLQEAVLMVGALMAVARAAAAAASALEVAPRWRMTTASTETGLA